MTLRPNFTCLGWLSFAGALSLAACADSGQTGSPVSQEPQPPYQSPGRAEPERPGTGSGVDSGGKTTQPDAVPRPLPKPGSTALLGSTLVVAEHGELVLLDVTAPNEPRTLGRAVLDEDAGAARGDAVSSSLLLAASLDRLVLGVGLTPHASESQLPSGTVARQAQEIVAVDASDLSAPRILSRYPMPADALEIAVRAGGYTALGARTAAAPTPDSFCEVGGGALTDIGIGSPPPAATGLWLEKFGPDAPLPERREFAAGHWLVATDQSHAIRIGVPAHETPRASFEVELVDLSSLETLFQTQLSPADLGTPLGAAFGADYSNGVLVIAGGSRLLGFDVASGSALPPLATPSPVENLYFLDPSQIALESSGSALAELDRSGASPALRLVPIAPGTPLTGPLLPFGNGYLALDGTGGQNQQLRVTSYVRDSAGALALVDQLQTDWVFSTNFFNGVPWRIDTAAERLSYTQPSADGGGLTGLIEGHAGQLSASDRAATEQMSPAPFAYGDTLLGFAAGVLQPIRIEPATSSEHLVPLAARRIVLEDVWFEVRHAGLIWARHRTDTGKTSLSVRAGEHDEPLVVELPHAVDAIVPIDTSHVAVFGFSVYGFCEYWREMQPDLAIGECGPDAGNGVSIVAIDAGRPRVVRSIALSSFLGGRPPAGIEQAIDWQGFLSVAPGKWALWAHFQQTCTSEATCKALGVPAYKSYATSGCSSGQTCDTGSHELTSGYFNASWLFPLDLSDPEAPVLEEPVREGAQLAAGGEVGFLDLARQLLGYDAPDGRVWGYAVDEPVYDASGSSVSDGHGQSLHRWYLQLVNDGAGEPSFEPRISVPGQPVLLGPGELAGGAAEHTAFTLEPRYAASGEQSLWLHRLRVSDGSAHIDQSLELGPGVLQARGVGERIAVLNGPVDYCAEDAEYRLQVLDASDGTLRLSSDLPLPASAGYGWGISPQQALDGTLHLTGGPALGGGTLTVDLGSDPPRLLSYSY
jgi:hypothetical protein